MGKKNPRPRGIDFLINWSMGSWSEDRVLEAVNSTKKYVAVRYGVSRTGPFTFDEFARYYERLKRTYLHGKRPDLIIFSNNDYSQLLQERKQIIENLMDTPDVEADSVVRRALFGIEVEVSRWHVGRMLEYQRKHGSKSTSILGPTFTIKDEDIQPLVQWVKYFNKEILVVQTFYDRAYVIPFSKALTLIWKINKGHRIQDVKRKKDSQTKKVTYFISCLRYGILFGEFDPMPSIEGKILIDDKGKIWPMVNFINGKLKITDKSKELFDEIAKKGILYPDVLKLF